MLGHNHTTSPEVFWGLTLGAGVVLAGIGGSALRSARRRRSLGDPDAHPYGVRIAFVVAVVLNALARFETDQTVLVGMLVKFHGLPPLAMALADLWLVGLVGAFLVQTARGLDRESVLVRFGLHPPLPENASDSPADKKADDSGGAESSAEVPEWMRVLRWIGHAVAWLVFPALAVILLAMALPHYPGELLASLMMRGMMFPFTGHYP